MKKKSAIFAFILMSRHQFAAGLEDAKLLCTIITDTAIGMVSLSQAPLQIY
jgi:hypothetical protein